MTEEDRNRHNDRRIARYSIVGSTLVAVVSILGSVWITYQASQSQANQSRSDFVRQQRQAAYSQAMTDSGELEILETSRCSGKIAGATPTQLAGTKKRLDVALTAVRVDEALVHLDGTDNADPYYQNLIKSHQRVIDACIAIAASKTAKAADVSALASAMTQEGTARQSFVDQASNDLGIPRAQ